MTFNRWVRGCLQHMGWVAFVAVGLTACGGAGEPTAPQGVVSAQATAGAQDATGALPHTEARATILAAAVSESSPVPAAANSSGYNPGPNPVSAPGPGIGDVGLPGMSPLPPVGVVQGSAPIRPPSTGAHAPTIEARVNGRWNDASTWSPARVPDANDVVYIPAARSVQLAGTSPAVNGVWVNGNLLFADADIDFTAAWVMVQGRLQAGTETAAYTRRATITLTGAASNISIAGMGTKALGVMAGGVLKLHGEHRLAWSQLAADAQVGASTLLMKDSSATWRAGDRLVLVSSGFDPREAELITVTAVSGNSLAFTPALRFAHTARMQTYNGKTLDQRAAIGLLSRNIVVRGDDQSAAAGFGGHIMVMAGATAQISGVEMARMGQRGRFGRYPLHWHLGGDVSAVPNYAAGNSVHSSFQRALVIHGTDWVTLDANVVYDIPNHAIVWAEDGNEKGNRLTRNLGVLVRSPAPADFAFRIDAPVFGNSSQAENRSAVFWGRSLNQHVIRGNISAGVLDGFGYFFDLFSPGPFLGGDEGGGLYFEDNVAHSTFKALNTGNQINYPEATTGHGLMVTGGTNGLHRHVFNNYTGFHNVSAVWLEDRATQLRDSIVADNQIGIMVLRGEINAVTVVGQSANPVAVGANVDGIRVVGSNHGGRRAPMINSATIINVSGLGVNWSLVDNLSPDSVAGSVVFQNTPRRVAFGYPYKFDFPESPVFAVSDRTGTLSGTGSTPAAPSRLMLSDSPLVTPQCQRREDLRAFSCPLSETLLLRANANLNLIDATGVPLYMRAWDFDDNGMTARSAMPSSYAASGVRYEVGIAARTSLSLVLEDAVGKSVELMFRVAGNASRIQQDGVEVVRATSLDQLREAKGSTAFFDALTGRYCSSD